MEEFLIQKKWEVFGISLGESRNRRRLRHFILNYMQEDDMQPDENPPIGLLICGEGNTEHIELMVLDEDHIRVAQYLPACPTNNGS